MERKRREEEGWERGEQVNEEGCITTIQTSYYYRVREEVFQICCGTCTNKLYRSILYI